MINDFADQVQVKSSAKINDIPSAAEPDCQLFCNNSGAVHDYTILAWFRVLMSNVLEILCRHRGLYKTTKTGRAINPMTVAINTAFFDEAATVAPRGGASVDSRSRWFAGYDRSCGSMPAMLLNQKLQLEREIQAISQKLERISGDADGNQDRVAVHCIENVAINKRNPCSSSHELRFAAAAAPQRNTRCRER